MLSKSQARLFFIVFTGGFSLVFLWLTVDTVRSVPARANHDGLAGPVAHGKKLWDDNNCMGCHTLLGEGAYYAPELTRAYERRGPVWLKAFLRDPQAMFPGERKMVQYDFSDAELDALIAFLKWVGEIDTNGFPADPDLALPTASAPAGNTAALAEAPAMFSQICAACHAVGGKGGNVGPALDGVANRYTAEDLDAWLANPQAVKPGTAMPNLGLSDEDRQSLISWLQTLKN